MLDELIQCNKKRLILFFRLPSPNRVVPSTSVSDYFDQMALFYLPSERLNRNISQNCLEDVEHLKSVIRNPLLWPINQWALTGMYFGFFFISYS